MRRTPASTLCAILAMGVWTAACGEPTALVPLLPPGGPAGPIDSSDSSDTAGPVEPADLSEMPLPPGRTLWSWDIVGEARLTDPGTVDASWTGTATWIWQDVSTGTEACIAELQTLGTGQDDACAPEDGCLFGMNVEHIVTARTGPDDCFDRLGLYDGEGPIDQWGLGYADAWDDETTAADHPLLYLWSRDSKTFPGAWRPMGTGTWNEDDGTFSYTFDTLWFFVVEG